IKPANIMITVAGQVKLLDVGLAKLVETARVLETDATRSMIAGYETQEGHIVGTISYMSPEQVGGRRPDARSDIFSFGAVFYEMVTGRQALQGDSVVSQLASVLKEEPLPIREMIAGIPDGFEQVVRGCLAKDAAR